MADANVFGCGFQALCLERFLHSFVRSFHLHRQSTCHARAILALDSCSAPPYVLQVLKSEDCSMTLGLVSQASCSPYIINASLLVKWLFRGICHAGQLGLVLLVWF